MTPCAADKDVELTYDPKNTLVCGCVLPLGGNNETSHYIGNGLFIMVEALCGMSGYAKYGRDVITLEFPFV